MTQTGTTPTGDGIATPDPAATGGMADTPGEARPASSPTDTSLVQVLGELEAAGYDPSKGDDGEYPADIQAAQVKLVEQDRARVAASAAARAPAAGMPAQIDN